MNTIAGFGNFRVLSVSYRDYDLEDVCSGTYKDDPRCFSMLWLLPDARDDLPALAESLWVRRFVDCHLKEFEDVRVKKFFDSQV